MSERDMSQANDELEKESLESTEAKAETRGLEEATHEPGSQVEQTGNIEQAETIESAVKGLVDASQSTDQLAGSQKGAEDISKGLVEKELPEGAQKQKQQQEQEDYAGVADGDFGSLTPGPGNLTGPDGKENTDTDPGLGLGDVGFGEKQGIDSSSENPEGEPFIPGKGPGGGDTEGGIDGSLPVTSAQEAEVMEMLARGASEPEIAAKEKQLQDDAVERHELVFGPPSAPPPPPPKTKKSSTESTPGEAGGGRNISPPTAEEIERVKTKTSGDEISMKDPDSAGSEGTPDSVLPKYADKMEAVEKAKRKFVRPEKKIGAEVVTDPDQDQEGVGGTAKGKKEAK